MIKRKNKSIFRRAIRNWTIFSMIVLAMLLVISGSDRWSMIQPMSNTEAFASTGSEEADEIDNKNEDIADNNVDNEIRNISSEDVSGTKEPGTSELNNDSEQNIINTDLTGDNNQGEPLEDAASDENQSNIENIDVDQTEEADADIIQPTYGMLSGREIDPDRPMIALTFDDGPYPPVTEELLEFLMDNDARATFFVVGYNIDKYEATIQEAYENGFEIANHTQSHASLKGLSKEELHDEVDVINELLNSFGIVGNLYLRPPYGEHDDTMEENLSVPMITWSIDSQDWLSRDAKTIEKRVLGSYKDGDIILMHDIYPSTLEAVKNIVPALIADGYQLVTVSEMFDAKEIETEAGVCYNSAK